VAIFLIRFSFGRLCLPRLKSGVFALGLMRLPDSSFRFVQPLRRGRRGLAEDGFVLYLGPYRWRNQQSLAAARTIGFAARRPIGGLEFFETSRALETDHGRHPLWANTLSIRTLCQFKYLENDTAYYRCPRAKVKHGRISSHLPTRASPCQASTCLNRRAEAINSFARWSRVSYQEERNYLCFLVASTREYGLCHLANFPRRTLHKTRRTSTTRQIHVPGNRVPF